MTRTHIQVWLSKFLDNCHMAQQCDDITNEEFDAFDEIREIIFNLDAKRRDIKE